MFHLQVPVAALDVQARAVVYREYLNHHPKLQDIQVGPHNAMAPLADAQLCVVV
jgi:hypothetical protein